MLCYSRLQPCSCRMSSCSGHDLLPVLWPENASPGFMYCKRLLCSLLLQ